MAYMLSANMDQGATDFQLEAAISKVYASVSLTCAATVLIKCSRASCVDGKNIVCVAAVSFSFPDGELG